MKLDYIWRWGPRYPRTLDRKGERCAVIVRGAMNSCLIEFEDGFRAVVSRNGLARLRPRGARGEQPWEN
jgi:hypothetical protein